MPSIKITTTENPKHIIISFIDYAQKCGFSISAIMSFLGFTRQNYYNWCKQKRLAFDTVIKILGRLFPNHIEYEDFFLPGQEIEFNIEDYDMVVFEIRESIKALDKSMKEVSIHLSKSLKFIYNKASKDEKKELKRVLSINTITSIKSKPLSCKFITICKYLDTLGYKLTIQSK